MFCYPILSCVHQVDRWTPLLNLSVSGWLFHQWHFIMNNSVPPADKLELLSESELNFQLNVGNKDHVTKPVLLNTLCWPRSEVVAIPDKLWENLSTEEKSSARKQESSQEGKTLGKISFEGIEILKTSYNIIGIVMF